MLTVKDLYKHYVTPDRKQVQAVNGVSFQVSAGKLFTLLGPSGCGKTTTLRCIAGLERPDSGVMTVGNQTIFDSKSQTYAPPNERGIGMVFQSYAIWPHMNVFANVAFPLEVSRTRKYKRSEIKERVRQALETVRLGGYEQRPATQLSGGQQQRLALARALVQEPKMLLLDEPLSNLDAKLRESMRFELKRLQRELGITTVYVTHDQGEALALSDEIAVMNLGQIAQLGSPNQIYQQPASPFVADFIGSTNFIAGVSQGAAESGGRLAVESERGVLQCTCVEPLPAGRRVLVSIRPEDIILRSDATAAAAENVLTGRATHRVFLGESIDYLIQVGSQELRVRAHRRCDFDLGQLVYLEMPADACVAIPARDADAPVLQDADAFVA